MNNQVSEADRTLKSALKQLIRAQELLLAADVRCDELMGDAENDLEQRAIANAQAHLLALHQYLVMELVAAVKRD